MSTCDINMTFVRCITTFFSVESTETQQALGGRFSALTLRGHYRVKFLTSSGEKSLGQVRQAVLAINLNAINRGHQLNSGSEPLFSDRLPVDSANSGGEVRL